MNPRLTRSAIAAAAMAIAILACSLGAGGGTAEPPTQPSGSGGGVPISKATPTEGSEIAPPTEPAPEATTPPQPTQAPTAAPAQPGDGEMPVTITNLNVVSPEEAPKVIGIVQNLSDSYLRDLRLTLLFKDADGDVAYTRQGTTWMNTLPAGQITGFEFFFPEGVPASAESVAVSVEWKEADSDYLNLWTRDGFDLLNVRGEWGEYYYTITGDVANNSGREARSVFMDALVYNADRRLIGIGTTYVQNLDPGAQAPFKILLAPTSMAEETLDHFEMLVEASLEN
jgi:hypothetical protein